MGDPRGSVRAAGPQSWPGGEMRQPAACRRMSPEAFLRGASVAWAYLHADERKAIRATCCNGRQLHDRLTTGLQMKLGGKKPREGRPEPTGGQQDRQQQQPSPLRLRASLGAMVARGARLQSLTVLVLNGPNHSGQAQLLAALEACSGCPLSRLELRGSVPLGAPMAEAVAAHCPQLSGLHLKGVRCGLPPEGPRRAEAAVEYHYGYSQLLTLCGPRLRELCVTGMGQERWPTLSYMALRRCTALTKLEIEAPTLTSSDGAPAFEPSVYSMVGQLVALRSLHLSTSSHPSSLDAVRRHATCVASLSTLTALTHLQLVPPSTYEDHGDNFIDASSISRELEGWCAAREAYRSSLLSALRCMPQLQSVNCSRLWLRPSELAPLTALTSLTLAGLLPPGDEHPLEVAGGRPGRFQPAGAALPPHLHTLYLDRVSPRTLARLRPSAAFTRLDVTCMQFGISDMGEDGRLLEQTVEAVGPAVRLLTAYRHRYGLCSRDRLSSWGGLAILGRGPADVRPRQESPNGHIEWIRHLQGLDDAYDCVDFDSLVLSAGELNCLGHTLRNLQGVGLLFSDFPVTGLPLLRNPMLRLTHMTVSLTGCGCGDMDRDTLEPLLLLLCRPHNGAAPLQMLKVTGCELDDLEGCAQSLREQLAAEFGVTGVAIDLAYDDMA